MRKNKEIEKIKSKIVPLLKKYKVTKAGIFGSYARGDQKKKSDVDILIEIDDNLSLFRIIELKRILEKKLKRKIDLVEYSLIRKELRNSILSDEVPILR